MAVQAGQELRLSVDARLVLVPLTGGKVKKTPLWLPMLGVYRGKADEAHSKPRPFEARFLWPIFGKKAPTTPPSTTPRAFLRVRYFDAGGSFVGMEERQMTDLAYCQTMRLTSQVPTDGSATVSVEYEGSLLYRAYFDDLSIALMTEPIAKAVQENHYDPFGLNLKGLETQGDFRWLYNAQNELETLHELDLYETPFRSYDAQLGRFHQADPLAPLYDGISPYQYAYNNPISFNDPMGLEAEVSPSVVPSTTSGAAPVANEVKAEGDKPSMVGRIAKTIMNFFKGIVCPDLEGKRTTPKIKGNMKDKDDKPKKGKSGNSGGGVLPGGDGSSSNFNQPNTYWIVDLDGVNDDKGGNKNGNGIVIDAINYANGFINVMNKTLTNGARVPALVLYAGSANKLRSLDASCLPSSSGYALLANCQDIMQVYALEHLPSKYLDYANKFADPSNPSCALRGFFATPEKRTDGKGTYEDHWETCTGMGDRAFREMGNAGFINHDRLRTYINRTGCQRSVPKHVVLAFVFLHVMGHNAGMQHGVNSHVLRGSENLCTSLGAEIYNIKEAFHGEGLNFLKGIFAPTVGKHFGR